jgi:hypothetical protein
MQIVIPFTADYRPLATGLGVVALELLLAVAVTNALRSRLPYGVWRKAHYATLVVWGLATIHGMLSGTDRSQTWLLWLYAATVGLVACAMVLRFARAGTGRRLGLGLVTAATAFIAVVGLAHVPQPASVSTTPEESATAEIAGPLTGAIDESATGILTVSGTAAGSAAFRIDLLTRSGQVSDSALQLRFANGSVCEGALTSLDETGFSGSCDLADGTSTTVRGSWTVSNGTVSGSISTDNAGTST